MSEDWNRKAHGTKTLDSVIYPEIEPGVINQAMIEEAYYQCGYTGEEARLHQAEPISYDRIKSLRLEYRNILRMDHLWILSNITKLVLCCNKIEVIENIEMLTSLVELDISFNYIKKIENLETLVNLEVLSLFNNEITKLENLETLEKLVILSLGNNRLSTLDGIKRFRFFKDLRVLNLEGNPVCERENFSMQEYVAAVLPQVAYYNYIQITPEDRESACEVYLYELREIEENEETELAQRALNLKKASDAERFSSSFVEYLNENQLFESLWKGDEDGRILMLVGGPSEDLYDEYKQDFHAICQEIFKLGLEKYEERQVEITEFMSNVEEGHLEVQKSDQSILEELVRYKEKVLEKATQYHKYLKLQGSPHEDDDIDATAKVRDKLLKVTAKFEEKTDQVWQKVMNQELHLHETTEETTLIFQRKIQEMISKFVEQAQSHFGQLRDLAIRFSENLFEIVSRFINKSVALDEFETVPEELRHCLDDREALSNIVAGMKDFQTQRIDEREDRLMQRSKEFIDKLVDKLNDDETKRNRARILEVSRFIELMNAELENLPNEITIEDVLSDEG